MSEHTLEQDFQHFMGYTNYPREIEDKLRVAYEHGSTRSVGNPSLRWKWCPHCSQRWTTTQPICGSCGFDCRTTLGASKAALDNAGFQSAEALATWLETFQCADEDGAINGRKWDAAQIAAAAIRKSLAPRTDSGQVTVQSDMQVGGRYNWKNQPERLVFIGRNWSGNGYWNQFEKVDEPGKVWCEVLDADLHWFERTNAALAAQGQGEAQHPDDDAVDAFAAAMKEKLAAARAKGRGGWQDKNDCPQQRLSDMLRAHVAKGDPCDVANFAMFLHQRGEAILPAPPASPAGVPDADVRWLLAQLRHTEFSHDYIKDEQRCDVCKRIKSIAMKLAAARSAQESQPNG